MFRSEVATHVISVSDNAIEVNVKYNKAGKISKVESFALGTLNQYGCFEGRYPSIHDGNQTYWRVSELLEISDNTIAIAIKKFFGHKK